MKFLLSNVTTSLDALQKPRPVMAICTVANLVSCSSSATQQQQQHPSSHAAQCSRPSGPQQQQQVRENGEAEEASGLAPSAAYLLDRDMMLWGRNPYEHRTNSSGAGNGCLRKVEVLGMKKRQVTECEEGR